MKKSDFAEHTAKGDLKKSLRILSRAGVGNPPMPGDELSPRSLTLDEQLRFAIANKRLIQLTYKGTRRGVEPHDYGVQKGVTKLFVYQLRGGGALPGKSVVGWRMLEVFKIEGCTVLEASFPGSRGASHQRHNEWDILYARVK